MGMLKAKVLAALLACIALPCRVWADDDWPEPQWPDAQWSIAEPEEVGLNRSDLERARDYALTGDGAGMITRHGRLVMEWGDVAQRFDLKSTTKSIGVTALGIAIADGRMRLDDRARDYVPSLGVPPEENERTGWLDRIRIRNLATQTAGFAKPGGFEPLLFEPGTKWHYSDGGPNWLADCITTVYGRDIDELMRERVFDPIGITRDDLQWRANAYRPRTLGGVQRREFGSGVHANVNAMARIGYLYLRRGRWKDRQLLPAKFVDQATRTVEGVVGLPEHDDPTHGNASDHYGMLWWNNVDGTLAHVPHDAYWSWGLYDSLIVVIPSLDLVVARAGASWKRDSDAHYDVLRPFLEPLVASTRAR